MFKTCTGCGCQWRSRDDFLSDPQVAMIGYQVHFEDLKTGLFLFNHLAPQCRTTVAIAAGEFTDLYAGPVFAGKMQGKATCPGYCLRRESLDACSTHCECAYVREVLHVIRAWNKTPA
jgi:hypothetical protein